MRISLLILISLSFLSPEAQMPLSFGVWNGSQSTHFGGYNRISDSARINRKWQLNTYHNLSTGIGLFGGPNISIISAPMGLQLNRRLNKNLYAFAGIAAAPAYFNINNAFNQQGRYKNYPGSSMFNANNLGVYSKVELGLMYINEEKTFSISGSINMERSNYPAYPVNGTNRNRQAPVMHSF